MDIYIKRIGRQVKEIGMDECELQSSMLRRDPDATAAAVDEAILSFRFAVPAKYRRDVGTRGKSVPGWVGVHVGELAKDMGLCADYMRLVLRGRTGVTYAVLRRIARLLGWPVPYLIVRIELARGIDEEMMREREIAGKRVWQRRIGERV
jgi:hypothetical protein